MGLETLSAAEGRGDWMRSLRQGKKQTNALRKERALKDRVREHQKNRLGNFEAWAIFDRDQLKQEVEGYEDGADVNWTELAKKHKIRKRDGEVPANVGQLLKLWLQKENVDTGRLKNQSAPVRVRRARIKVGGGTDITFPRKRTEREISKELSIMIRDGQVPIGEFVVPKTFRKYFLNRNTNRIETKTVTIEGRKLPLQQLREQLLQSQQPFMRDATNYDHMTKEQLTERLIKLGEYHKHKGDSEEAMRYHLQDIATRRTLMYWEDGATLANHGYILYLVATTYDPAVHLTDWEYHQKFHLHISVQSKVEQPKIYLIARCGSSDAEQMLYAETRRDDLPSLADPVMSPDGQAYTDTLRFFKGDNPARQSELGQQRGGYYPCVQCPVDIRGVRSFWESCHTEKPTSTIGDRQQFLLEGPVTCMKASSSLPDPFSQLTKEELQEELTSRGAVPYESVDTMSKKDLQQEMKRTLRGTKRMPTLLQPNPTQNITELNLQHLEAPGCECMHDCCNHTKNILEELPARVSKEVAETIQRVKQTILGDKDIIRASDMRYTLLILIKELEQQGKARPEVMQLLYTQAEIQRACYAAADDRTTTTIYRLSNVAFLHHLMMRECFPGNAKIISNRKLWGSYYHSIRDHMPTVYRIAPLSSLMAENEERHFATIKRITKSSANYANPGHIIQNVIVRFHFNNNAGTRTHQDNKISETAKLLPQLRTRIPIALMKKYPRETQTHCEHVPDFLHPGYGAHWHIEGEEVVFHDSPSEDPPFHPAGPFMHHFRSTSLQEEDSYLKETWNRCLQDEVAMPLFKLWIFEPDGQTLSKKVTTPFLDMGYDFDKDKFPYMKENTLETEEEDEEEEMAADDPEETMEDEEVVRLERVDPEPELEEYADSGTRETGDQAPASQVHPSSDSEIRLQQDYPDQSPARIRMERRGEGSTMAPTPPKTPGQGADLRSDLAIPGNSASTPIRTDTGVQQGTMTPPPTPCVSKENSSRAKPQWKTKLGCALAVVLGEVPIVQRTDQVKAKLKMTPKNKFYKDEFDRCISQVSGQLSIQLHKDRRTFEVWEKDFAVQNGRLPIASDVRHSESTVQKRIRYAEHLLRTFGVKL
ncbi:Hypp5281 [Branchiostoma lanceolatum]|uniref:Hypp5281 protein n=1 Tax=Branchiostoma lanceolatum TaxID=7740 RepID=A0A8K0AG83_BRALA|nr:Hypp5281 [Branchiostoma lanceolatum]